MAGIIESVARTLSEKFGITVISVGEEAYTDGKKIVVPEVDEDDKEAMKWMRGFIDHEVAHITEGSSFSSYGRARKQQGEVFTSYLNALDDIRIEELFSKKHLGSIVNLGRTHRKTLKELENNMDQLPLHFLMCVYLICHKRYKLPRGFPQKVIDDGKAFEKYAEYAQAGPEFKELRKKLNKLWKELPDEYKKVSKAPSPDGEPDGGGNDSNEAESVDEKDSDGGGGDDSGGDGGSERGDSGDDDTDQEADSTRDEGDGETDGESNNGAGDVHAPQSGTLGGQRACPALESDEFDIMSIAKARIEESVKLQNNLAKSAKDKHKSVKDEMNMRIWDSQNKDPRTYAEIIGTTRKYASGVRQKVVQMVLGRKKDHWQRGVDSGKFDGSKVPQIATGIQTKYMKRRVEVQRLNAAVQILIDCSSSMNEGGWATAYLKGDHGTSRFAYARIAALVLGDILDICGVNFEIMGFSTSHRASTMKEAIKEEGLKVRSKSNTESLATQKFKGMYRYMPVAFSCPKEFGEHWKTKGAKKMAHMVARGGTPMWDCMWEAKNRLAKQPQKKKLMIVLTDGESGYGHGYHGDASVFGKNTIAGIEKMGIDVRFIGIGTDYILRHAPGKTAIVRNQEDLPRAMIEIASGGLGV